MVGIAYRCHWRRNMTGEIIMKQKLNVFHVKVDFDIFFKRHGEKNSRVKLPIEVAVVLL